MFKIETYQNPHEYFHSFSLEKNALHVTGDSSFRTYLIQKSDSKEQVLTYDQMQQKLFPKWNSPFSDLLLKSKVRAILEKLLPYQYQRSMDHFLQDWIHRFRFLVELGLNISAEPLEEEQTPERKLFHEVWEKLLKDAQVKRLLFSRQQIDIGKLIRQVFSPGITAIYVYHMIQLDASRMMFFCQCVQSGFQVVFRIPYIASLPDVYKPWRQVFEKIGSPFWLEKHSDRTISMGNRWASFVEGKSDFKNVSDSRNIELFQFVSPVHFNRFLMQHHKKNKKGRILAANSKRLNQMFRRSMSSGSTKEKNCFPLTQLPCNRFFFHLYECKREDQTVWIEYEHLFECITSGWIMVRDVSGIEAISFLLDLEPYMKGIKTVDEAIERLQRLEELRGASDQFDQLARERTGRSRIKMYLSNPFRVFPYVHRNRYSVTLKQLQDLFKQFNQIALSLLPEEQKQMSLKKHMQLLRQLYNKVKEHLPINAEERERMDKAFRTTIFESWNMSRAELKECVHILLSRTNVEEDLDNLNQLEGLVLQSDFIHVTSLSIQGLKDYSIEVEIVPLTFSWLKEWSKKQFETDTVRYNAVLLALFTHYQLNQVGLSYFYFQLYFLLAFAKKEVQLSWIQGVYDNDEESSVLELLNSLYGKQQEIPYWNPQSIKLQFPDLSSREEKHPINAKNLLGQIPAVYWLDQDFCSRKFFFNSLVELHPIYDSDFHQRIVFSILGALFTQQALGEEGVKEHLDPLFPQWTQTLKRNLVETASKTDLLVYRSFQNISYPKAMEKLQRLYSRYRVTKRWKVDFAFERDRLNEKEWLQEWLQSVEETHVKAESGSHCAMCPYLMICDKGEFTVDGKYSSQK